MNSTNEHKDLSDSFLQVRKLENVAMLARATACVSLWQLMANELDMKRIQFLPPKLSRKGMVCLWFTVFDARTATMQTFQWCTDAF